MKLRSATVLAADGKRWALGDYLRDGIHAVIDRAPLSAATKARIKGCGGCGRRRDTLNRVGARLASMVNPSDTPPTPE